MAQTAQWLWCIRLDDENVLEPGGGFGFHKIVSILNDINCPS